MGLLSRRKGATFEREIANDIRDDMGIKVTRNLDQARDGGNDINLAPFRLECKRYAKIAVYEWLRQAVASMREPYEVPVVIARADNEEAIAIMRWSDFKKLAREEITKEMMR